MRKIFTKVHALPNLDNYGSESSAVKAKIHYTSFPVGSP